MAKNPPKYARPRRMPAPYTKYKKRSYPYPWENRLANGELRTPANQHPSNKYR